MKGLLAKVLGFDPTTGDTGFLEQARCQTRRTGAWQLGFARRLEPSRRPNPAQSRGPADDSGNSVDEMQRGAV